MLVAVLVGAVCAVLSCYLVLKSWSLMGDAVSHAVLPGIVIAFMAGLPLSVAVFLIAFLFAPGGILRRNVFRAAGSAVDL